LQIHLPQLTTISQRFLLTGLILFLLSGCASVPGPPDERDPFESYNRAMHKFNTTVDDAVIRPVAETYRDYVPKPVQTGIHNFFDNLQDVIVLLNDVLQFKFEQAASDLSRLVWNTTLGLFGIFDVATYMELPKHNEDFGQTLAAWGVPNGPYLVLPFLGASTVRDAAALPVDIYTHPTFRGLVTDEAVSLASVGLRFIDLRANLLSTTEFIDQAAFDPYIFTRDSYLQYRRNLIYDGNPPPEEGPGLEPASDKELEMELELELELEKNNKAKQTNVPPSP